MESRKIFDPEIEEGWVFDGRGLPEGFNPDAPKEAVYVVTDVYPEHVVLDGNHPLAGIAIRLHIKVEGVREATLEEIGKGSCGTGFFKIH
jgi:FKBP-type peptidyl-prolyl cis-trans isomerase SlyD